ncbi:MAG: hypothetical protein HOE90_06580 [Bacteriovoracaceae bacterium]|nr:hypothetical protein [Bacteriovoracaceae bacterium]
MRESVKRVRKNIHFKGSDKLINTFTLGLSLVASIVVSPGLLAQGYPSSCELVLTAPIDAGSFRVNSNQANSAIPAGAFARIRTKVVGLPNSELNQPLLKSRSYLVSRDQLSATLDQIFSIPSQVETQTISEQEAINQAIPLFTDLRVTILQGLGTTIPQDVAQSMLETLNMIFNNLSN